MSIEDRALERLMDDAARRLQDEARPTRLRPMSDAEHRRTFGWGWDDPDDEPEMRLVWAPPETL